MNKLGDKIRIKSTGETRQIERYDSLGIVDNNSVLWLNREFINLSAQGRKAGQATMKKVSRGKNGRFMKIDISHSKFVKLSSKPSEHRELLRNHENRIKVLEEIFTRTRGQK